MIAFSDGLALHQAGRLDDAERVYRQLIEEQPAHCDALQMLGVLHAQRRTWDQALDCFDAALGIGPDASCFNNRGNVLKELGRHEEALASYNGALDLAPDYAEAHYNRGTLLAALERFDEAALSFAKTLATKPDHLGALISRARVLQQLSQPAMALASCDKALAIVADHPGALYQRAIALHDLRRHDDALACYDKFLAQHSGDVDGWNKRGNVLLELKRYQEALASFDRALAIASSAKLFYNRAVALRGLERYAEAASALERAIALDPDLAAAYGELGFTLAVLDRIDEAFDRFREHSFIACRQATADIDPPPYRLKHDREQLEYLIEAGLYRPSDGVKPGDDFGAVLRLEGGERLSTPAVNPSNDATAVETRWLERNPRLIVIDNLLTEAALDELRHFCLGSTIWRRNYSNGYIGAFRETGFACPLLAQIGRELRDKFPRIIGNNPLVQWWAFKYDSELTGINAHADFAAVNVNFWITPDEANLDPDSGGLTIWDVPAPMDWSFETFNRDEAAIRTFLRNANGKSVTVPYRANRAVIFDSDLIHETDRMKFKSGYRNRRLNITMLYGWREAPAS